MKGGEYAMGEATIEHLRQEIDALQAQIEDMQEGYGTTPDIATFKRPPPTAEHHAPLTRKDCLEQAMECVTKDRNATYGDPEDNFRTIAAIATEYLAARYGKRLGITLDALDVAMIQASVKIARVASSPTHADNYVDLAGYAACAAEVATR